MRAELLTETLAAGQGVKEQRDRSDLARASLENEEVHPGTFHREASPDSLPSIGWFVQLGIPYGRSFTKSNLGHSPVVAPHAVVN